MKTRIVECKTRKGKGHVLDAGSGVLSFLHPAFLLMAIFERNDRRGLTRNRCGRCGGHGYIEVRARAEGERGGGVEDEVTL